MTAMCSLAQPALALVYQPVKEPLDGRPLARKPRSGHLPPTLVLRGAVVLDFPLHVVVFNPIVLDLPPDLLWDLLRADREANRPHFQHTSLLTEFT